MKRETFEQIRQKEGDYRSGEYKGFRWKIKRHPDLLHLCGYIEFPADLDISKFEFQKQECTYNETIGNKIILGFDCGHYKMLIPKYLYYTGFDDLTRPGNIYWTMEMCFAVIRNSIDKWLEQTWI